MNSATNSRIAVWAGTLLATVTVTCGKAETAPVASSEPAGNVEAVEGQVTAVRAAEGSAHRPLVVAGAVWADDTVTTPNGASVAIRLTHNAALWRLEGGFAKRVDQTAAWKAPKDAAPQAIAQRAEPVQTASAGRHSAHEAAGTAESAARAAPASAPAPAPPPVMDAPPAVAAAPAEAVPVKVGPATERQPPRHAVRKAAGGAPAPKSVMRGGSSDDFGFEGLGGDGGSSGGGRDEPSGKGSGGSAAGGSLSDAPARLPAVAIVVKAPDEGLKSALLRLLNQRKAALARCAQQASQAGAALPPKFVVRLEIGGAGAVTVLAIEGALDPLKACARAVLASLRGVPDTNPAVEAEVVIGVR